MNLNRVQFPDTARAVLVTLAYTDQFSYPLTFAEIHKRCLLVELQGAPLSQVQLKQAVEFLSKHNVIESSKKNGETFYFLSGRKNTVTERYNGEVAAATKQSEIDRVLKFFQRIPFIQAVYLTGSQAMQSASTQSDIDFMIITLPKRVWLTRVIVSVFAQLHGRRRSWNREEPGSWCFNLWLDMDHLQVHATKQDSYRAYEVLQAQVLFDRAKVSQRFLSENQWVETYLKLPQVPEKSTASSATTSPSMFSALFDAVDWVAWKFQAMYMSRHRTTEKVGRGYAFFHPRDTGKLIQNGWLHSLERCLSKHTAAEILQPYVRPSAR